MPNIVWVILNSVKKWSIEDVNKFLENSIPEKLTEFWFNYFPSDVIDVSQYPSLYISAFSVTNSFSIFYSKITQHEFEALMIALKHCESVSFEDCIIPTDRECSFSAAVDSNIKSISLSTTIFICFVILQIKYKIKLINCQQ